jgi:UDP-2-acetamido-2-deoxy-ribo-hexuluronate aminotransferase
LYGLIDIHGNEQIYQEINIRPNNGRQFWPAVTRFFKMTVNLSTFVNRNGTFSTSMKKIEMVDLRSQYLRLKDETDEAISSVLKSSAFINGPEVRAFREELARYLGIPHIVTCANGTDALQVALMAMDLHPGDEVITSNFTFISTVEVLVLLGLRPVLADVDPGTFNIDPGRVAGLITPRTKGIIPVHLFGQPSDLDPIVRMAHEHRLFVLEDNAQSLGSMYTGSDGITRPAGAFGLAATTSFFPTKLLACYGDGGAIMTHDPELAERMEMITRHGARVKYHHDRIGVNSRLDAIQAAILRVNLRHLDEFIERRRQVAAYYFRQLAGHPGIILPATASGCTHVWHQFTIRVEPSVRDNLRESLTANGIPTQVYYPVPLSLQKAFAPAGYREGDFPVTENLCRSVLSLPIHPEMEEEQLDHICTALIKTLDHER